MPTRISQEDARRAGLKVRKDGPYRRTVKLSMPRNDPYGIVTDTPADGRVVMLYLPVLSLSGNRWIRMHGLKRDRYSKDFGWFFKVAETHVGHLKRKAQARVLFTRVSTSKEQDVDNLVAGLKPLQDWLVKLGWLVDDSPAWLDYQLPLQLRPTGALRIGTYIQILYLEPGKETTP